MNANLRQHYKATLRLGWPIAVGQLGIILTGFADTIMVGHYSTDALAAASFVNNLFNLVTFLLMGFAYGLTPLVSGLVGKGDHRGAGAMLRQGLAANVAFCAALLTVMGTLYFFLDRLGQPAELLPLIRPYYLVMLASMGFVMLFNVLRQFTDGTQHTAAGMWVLLTGNVLNIVGNWLLIFGVGGLPELGLLGAGISTLSARVLMGLLIVLVVWFAPRYADYRAGFAAARLRGRELRRVAAMSLPVAAQSGLEAGAFSFSAVMAGWLGTAELAAYQILMTIGTLGFLFYYSFGAGMSIRLAAFMGTGDRLQVRLAEQAGRHILLLLATVASLVFFFLQRPLIAAFTSDAAVVQLSLGLILPLILYQYADAVQISYANALRGVSRVVSMMKVAFVSYILIGIPAGYLLGFPCGFGIRGIFLAFSLGLGTAAFFYRNEFRK